MSSTFEKRKAYVNKMYGKMVSGTSMSNKQKTKLMRKLWKQAKKKYK